MKRSFFLAIILCIGLLPVVTAQNNMHPTIESLKVVYKSTSQTTLSAFSIAGIPQATVTLKASSNSAKIHFKIYSVETDSILHTANYYLDSLSVTNSMGKKLFENNNGSVFLSPGVPMPLKPYSYKILTEDSLQNVSPAFIKIQ